MLFIYKNILYKCTRVLFYSLYKRNKNQLERFYITQVLCIFHEVSYEIRHNNNLALVICLVISLLSDKKPVECLVFVGIWPRHQGALVLSGCVCRCQR